MVCSGLFEEACEYRCRSVFVMSFLFSGFQNGALRSDVLMVFGTFESRRCWLYTGFHDVSSWFLGEICCFYVGLTSGGFLVSGGGDQLTCQDV